MLETWIGICMGDGKGETEGTSDDQAMQQRASMQKGRLKSNKYDTPPDSWATLFPFHTPYRTPNLRSACNFLRTRTLPSVLSDILSVFYPVRDPCPDLFISTPGNCNDRYYSTAMDQTVSIPCVHATDEDFCNAGIASEPLSMNIISCVLRIQAMELLHPNSSPRYFPYSRNQTWSR